MPTSASTPRRADAFAGEDGFTLIEMMVAMLVLMVVSGTVIKGVMDMADLHTTLMNRTDMHAGVRNVTELLTQEIGQAGRVSLPGQQAANAASPVTISANTAIGATTLNVATTSAGNSATDGMFVGERLLVDTGDNAETTTVTAINSATQVAVSAMRFTHDAGDPVSAPGGFAAGVIPPAANPDSATKLKIFGDINGDGRMVYIEYWCDTASGRLYRNAMPFNAAAKQAYTVDMVMIDNILPNPAPPGGGAAPNCFTYQTQVAGGVTYVTDVAITLTVRSQNRDRKTGTFQTETKALLNVSPRNVFDIWQLAGLGITNRVQPTPASVTALLP